MTANIMMSVDRRMLAGEVLATVDRRGDEPVLAVGHSADRRDGWAGRLSMCSLANCRFESGSPWCRITVA
ncbi:hypothetical protein [Candidatus Poriferisodalis sp.]|uniref:hypothetical protein n=1 Tax=Candidatus Poriferisodalis sp. TaxID=3101277 RepID=UPI003B011870